MGEAALIHSRLHVLFPSRVKRFQNALHRDFITPPYSGTLAVSYEYTSKFHRYAVACYVCSCLCLGFMYALIFNSAFVAFCLRIYHLRRENLYISRITYIPGTHYIGRGRGYVPLECSDLQRISPFPSSKMILV